MLAPDDRDVLDRGLVNTVKGHHDEPDTLVAEAYVWAADLTSPELLAHLATLNAARAVRERQDDVKYLRPAYQNPNGTVQTTLLDAGPTATAEAALPDFPRGLGDQSKAVRQLLRDRAQPLTAQEIARAFRGYRKERVERIDEILDVLVVLGQAREVPGQDGYTA